MALFISLNPIAKNPPILSIFDVGTPITTEVKYTQFFPQITDNASFQETSAGALLNNAVIEINAIAATNVVVGATINWRESASRGYAELRYIVSGGNEKVVKILPSGLITTVLLFMEEFVNKASLTNKTNVTVAASIFAGVGALLPPKSL